MDIRNVKLSLNVKSNKVTKILLLLLKDSIADFQKNHPKHVPALVFALKHGDTEKALNKLETFIKTVDDLKNSLEEVKEQIINSMPPLEDGPIENAASTFINPDGNRVHKMETGKSAVIASSKGIKL
jgi:replication-associated recombination protein RarA